MLEIRQSRVNILYCATSVTSTWENVVETDVGNMGECETSSNREEDERTLTHYPIILKMFHYSSHCC